MNKNVIVVLSVVMALVLGAGGCVTINPAPASQPPPSPPPNVTPPPISPEAQSPPSWRIPPVVPQEVLSVWNRQPPLESSPADVSGELFLKPNLHAGEGTEAGNMSNDGLSVGYSAFSAGSLQETARFPLKQDEWVDVIVSSLDVPVYCFVEQPGAVSFELQGRTSIPELARPVGFVEVPEDELFKSIIFAVFSGKRLYENHVTSTQKGTLFTSAYRLFACAGAGDYLLYFSNFNRQQGAQITYRVYRLGTTPSWGTTNYFATKLWPWMNRLAQMLISGEISLEEYRKAESEWLRQLMD